MDQELGFLSTFNEVKIGNIRVGISESAISEFCGKFVFYENLAKDSAGPKLSAFHKSHLFLRKFSILIFDSSYIESSETLLFIAIKFAAYNFKSFLSQDGSENFKANNVWMIKHMSHFTWSLKAVLLTIIIKNSLKS